MKWFYVTGFVIFLVCLNRHGVAQKEVHVVSHTVSKEIHKPKLNQLHVDGQNADLLITGWDNNYVDIQLDLISKHYNKTQAEADLSKLMYLIERKKNIVYIRNYVETEELSERPESVLRMIATIYVPKTYKIEIKNKIGKISISEMESDVRINTRYSNIDLTQNDGDILIRDVLGNIDVLSHSGKFELIANRSNLHLIRDTRGTYNIEARFGKVTIQDLTHVDVLTIDGDGTELNLPVFDWAKYNLNINCRNGKIHAPNQEIDFRIKIDGSHYSIVESAELASPRIQIRNSFGDIHLLPTEVLSLIK